MKSKFQKPLSVMLERMREQVTDGELDNASRTVIAQIGRLMDGLNALQASPDPTRTQEYNQAQLEKLAKEYVKIIDNVEARVNELVTDGIVDLDKKIEKTAGLRPGQQAPEIRAAVRTMRPNDRRAALSNAVESDDAEVVAALTTAHPITTGLDSTHITRMREAFVQKHAGAEYAAQQRLSESVSTASRAVGTARAAAAEIAKGDALNG